MKNKVTTYLLYAIGEIALVVIGILIAVSIDDWNSERKKRLEAAELSRRLLSETLQNKEILGNEIQELDSELRTILEFLEMTGYDYQQKDPDKTDSLIYQVISSPNFEMNNAVLNEVIATGQLTLIKSDSLRNLIYGLPNVFAVIKGSIDIINSLDNLYLYKRIYETVTLRSIDSKFSPFAAKLSKSNFSNIDNRIILADVQFESMVDNKYFLINTLRNSYMDTQQKLDILISLLKEEIGE